MLENLLAFWPDRWETPEHLLWLAVALVVIVLLCWVLVRSRARKDAILVTDSPDMLDVLAPSAIGMFTRALPWLMAAAVLWILFAPLVGKPVRVSLEPHEQATVVMALDNSSSTLADDVLPTRKAGLFSSARTFLNELDPQIQVAIVLFDENATVQMPPTTDRVILGEVLDELEAGQTGEATCISCAIDVSVALAKRVPLSDDGSIPARVALLSDGKQEGDGLPPMEEAVARAVDANIEIDTIAYGTPEGQIINANGEPSKVPPDIPGLARIADETGGTPYRAESQAELTQAYADIGSSIGFSEVVVDAWEPFPVLAGLIVLAAVLVVFFTRTHIFFRRRSIQDEVISEDAIEKRVLNSTASAF